MPYCGQCGKEVTSSARFCPACGSPVRKAPAASPDLSPTPTPSPAPVEPASAQASSGASPASVAVPSRGAAPTADPKVPTTESSSKGRTKTWTTFYLVAAVVAAIFFYLFVDYLPGKPHQVINAQPQVAFIFDRTMDTVSAVPIKVTIDAGELRFPIDALREHRMVEFEYPGENHAVPLLAYVNNEGKLVTSIRLCEPCNSKTFTIEGEDLHCGNCETAWSLRTLDGLQGSCQKYPPDPIPSTVRGESVVINVTDIVNWKIRI